MPKDRTHINNHAGIRFRKAIARAGNSSSGIAAIERLAVPAELGGIDVEMEANGCSCFPMAIIYSPAGAATIGRPGPRHRESAGNAALHDAAISVFRAVG